MGRYDIHFLGKKWVKTLRSLVKRKMVAELEDVTLWYRDGRCLGWYFESYNYIIHHSLRYVASLRAGTGYLLETV